MEGRSHRWDGSKIDGGNRGINTCRGKTVVIFSYASVSCTMRCVDGMVESCEGGYIYLVNYEQVWRSVRNPKLCP
jgi:hypothetical protein